MLILVWAACDVLVKAGVLHVFAQSLTCVLQDLSLVKSMAVMPILQYWPLVRQQLPSQIRAHTIARELVAQDGILHFKSVRSSWRMGTRRQPAGAH